MVGGRVCCLSCFVTYIAVLGFMLCLHDVEACNSSHILHKKVGGTVEFRVCSSITGLNSASWKHKSVIVAEIDQKESRLTKYAQLEGRVYLSPTNFSLIVTGLTPQDSGNFSFVSEVNGEQQRTVTHVLQVHEPLTNSAVTYNFINDALNESCTFLLECNATPSSNVKYQWTVRNQTHNGPRLVYEIRQQDGETEFICRAFNNISDLSKSIRMNCSNNTSEIDQENRTIYVAVTTGVCLTLVIGFCIFIIFHRKQRRAGNYEDETTVYADISDVTTKDKTGDMMICSVYETVDKRDNTVKPGLQTVYDQIQPDRIRMC